MASVNSGDVSSTAAALSGMQYQMKNLNEQNEKELEKAKEDAQKQTDSLRKKYDERYDDLKADYDKALEEARESANDVVKFQRENSDREYNYIKKSVYDKTGRVGADAENYRDQRDEAKKLLDAEAQKYERRMSQLEEHTSRQRTEMERDHAAELEENAKLIQEAASEAYNSSEGSEKRKYDIFRESEQKKYDMLNQDVADSRDQIYRQSVRQIEDVERDYKHREKLSEKSRDVSTRKLSQEFNRKLSHNSEIARREKEAETQRLRAQVNDLNQLQAEEMSRKNALLGSVMGAVTEDYKNRENTIVNRYELELAKAKTDQVVGEETIIQKNQETLRNQAADHTDLLRRKETQAFLDRKDLMDQNAMDRAQVQKRHKMDMELAQKSREKLAESLDEQSRATLETQSKAFGRSSNLMRQDLNDKIRGLESQLQYLKTSDDFNNVSPALEARMRADIEKKYAELQTEETRRNQEQVDSIVENYRGRLHETVRDSENKQTNLLLDSQRQTDQDRKKFLDFAYDSETSKAKQLSDLERNQERRTLKSRKTYARDMDQQRRSYEEMIRSRELDNQDRISTISLDRDFNEKMLRREFGHKINEMVDKYETKLSELEANHGEQLQAVREEANQRIRDSERQSRSEREREKTAFQQRIKEVESQHAEYRKTMERDFEKQLDESRKANARLMAKKS